MKKITVLMSVLLLAVMMMGQGLAWAEDAAANPAKKVCKCNFKPGNKKHSTSASPVTK
jgi:hypothetical protein